jgi:hypothetical protein
MPFSSQAVLCSASELEGRVANVCAHDREIRFALNRLGKRSEAQLLLGR